MLNLSNFDLSRLKPSKLSKSFRLSKDNTTEEESLATEKPLRKKPKYSADDEFYAYSGDNFNDGFNDISHNDFNDDFEDVLLEDLQEMSVSDTPTDTEQVVADIMSRQFTDSNGFIFLMLLLLVAILWTGVVTTSQIQHYRQEYGKLQQMKQDYLKLQVEHKRLLLEQQTFSTTQQIATRAVSELNMYFPSAKNKLILQPIASSEVSNRTQSEGSDEVSP